MIGQIGAGMMLAGAVVALMAFAWLGVGELRRARGAKTASPSVPRLDRPWLWILGAAIVIGAAVRFVGLDVKGLSHPEAYTPGINLPAGISEPPPRHEFVETAVWHFRAEPHPLGYYMAMWAWTKAFGASLASIRIPEAILGVLSLFVIYRVGSLAFEPRVGVIAAALLSLHGFHIFWSQAARMYVPGAFLGLVSTWLLLEMGRLKRPSPAIELSYVAATVAGALTVEFFCPLLCIQILWAALNHGAASARRMARIGYFQALAFILAAPTLSHAWMLARTDAAPPPTLGFLAQYFSFGFLFQHGAYPERLSPLPMVEALLVLALSLFLIYLGLRAPTAETDVDDPPPAPSIWPLAVAALGASALMLGIAAVSDVRQEELAALSVLPLLLLVLPLIVGSLRSVLSRFGPLEAMLRKGRNLTALIPLQAFLPTLLLFAVSYQVALTAPRAYVIFVPYLLVVIAAGVLSLTRWRRHAVIVALAIIFPASALLLRAIPLSPRDYQGLARAMDAKMQADDLVFAPPRDWAYTPIFYYLDPKRIVAANYADAVRRAPRSRVWVLSMLRQGPTIEMANALSGYRIADKVEALQAGAVLLVPAP